MSLSDYTGDRFRDMVWLAKLSIVSFQRWFPKSSFLLLYNGYDLDGFCKLFHGLNPKLLSELLIVDQRHPHVHPEKFENPYHFVPVNGGVWMKWVPFRFDITKTEIAIDTDIICISEPKSWEDYFNSDACILVAAERYEKVLVNTCGDFHAHPLVKNKKPFNCGIVGQKAGHDYSEKFFDITRHVKYGQTHDSLFITEQGAINVWVRSLGLEGVGFQCLDFQKNAWMRDFIYFMEKGVSVETIHAVAWHKKIAKALGPILERKVQDTEYDNKSFLSDILKEASNFDPVAYHLLARQIGTEQMNIEYLIAPK